MLSIMPRPATPVTLNEITRQQLENLIADLIWSTLNRVAKVLRVCEVETQTAQDNSLSATFKFDGIALAPKGTPRILVQFDLYAGGELILIITNANLVMSLHHFGARSLCL